jgi:hypothetical protein
MAFEIVVLVLLCVVLVVVSPFWSFSSNWGYGPAVVVGSVLMVLMMMALSGQLPR